MNTIDFHTVLGEHLRRIDDLVRYRDHRRDPADECNTHGRPRRDAHDRRSARRWR